MGTPTPSQTDGPAPWPEPIASTVADLRRYRALDAANDAQASHQGADAVEDIVDLVHGALRAAAADRLADVASVRVAGGDLFRCDDVDDITFDVRVAVKRDAVEIIGTASYLGTMTWRMAVHATDPYPVAGLGGRDSMRGVLSHAMVDALTSPHGTRLRRSLHAGQAHRTVNRTVSVVVTTLTQLLEHQIDAWTCDPSVRDLRATTLATLIDERSPGQDATELLALCDALHQDG